ncbi:MAG TPA: glycosyltransferase [Acidimicrobiales bacterium]|jgi:trehalose synthase|nr:glycosyltransferase [Acidimicrobiales bacterium]
MQEVLIEPVQLDTAAVLLGEKRITQLAAQAERTNRVLAGRTVWNVNSTAQGGGVAEMLEVLLAYARGGGVDTRWLVIHGVPDFFAVTKRLHNWLHGVPGDGGDLGAAEHRIYEQNLADNEGDLTARVRPGDVVILHDPQTTGLIAAMKRAGAVVIWRCHVGADDRDNPFVVRAWEFLAPYLEDADAFIFSRATYPPAWLDGGRVHVIPPSIDPFSAKNQELAPGAVRSILARIGLLTESAAEVPPEFMHRDGLPGTVTGVADIVSEGGRLDPDAPVVAQISRWDRLKDMFGVMCGFADHVGGESGANLVLAGPEAKGVADDPEALAVYSECLEGWRRLRPDQRRRIRLVRLPMDDVEANAAMVNALQRHAAVVVQKSLVEGFGLTVAEAMWKARAVVASAVGGINDQIVDGESGRLLADPTDLVTFGAIVDSLLHDPGERQRLGRAARQRVLDQFMGDRHLIQYGHLLEELLVPAAPPAPSTVRPAGP